MSRYFLWVIDPSACVWSSYEANKQTTNIPHIQTFFFSLWILLYICDQFCPPNEISTFIMQYVDRMIIYDHYHGKS